MGSRRSYGLIAAAAVLWGSTGIAVSKSLSAGMSQLGMAAAMTAVGTAVLVAFAGAEGVRALKPDLILYGITALAAFRFLYVLSVQINGAGVTASLLYTAPLIVAAVSPLAIGEKPSAADVALACAAVAGAYLASNPSLQVATALGFLVGLALACIYAATIVAVKYFYSKGYSWKEVMAQSTLAAAPTLALLTAATRSAVVINLGTLPYILWGGGVTIGLATILYLEGLKGARAVEASVIATLEPVSALALASLILGEEYVPLQLVGIGMILASATGIIYRSSRERKSEGEFPKL